MFNRITINYSSPSPMTGVMLYSVDGETVQDIFHLEPVQDGTLVHLIKEAENGKTATQFRILSLTAPRGMSPDVTIHALTTDMASVSDMTV